MSHTVQIKSPGSKRAASWLPAVVFPVSLLFAGMAPAEQVDSFADNGYGRPVSNLQQPAAEYFNGRDVCHLPRPRKDPYVAAYIHATGKWTGPVQAGVNTIGKPPDQVNPGEIDHHGRPALIVDRQSYFHSPHESPTLRRSHRHDTQSDHGSSGNCRIPPCRPLSVFRRADAGWDNDGDRLPGARRNCRP